MYNCLLTLGSWEAILGPAERMTVVVEKRVLLFDAKPWDGILRPLHHLIARLAAIRLCKRKE